MLHLTTPAQAAHWLRGRMANTPVVAGGSGASAVAGAFRLQTDSRRVGPGDAFLARVGAATDGRVHVAAARAQGAVACLVEHEGVAGFDLQGDDVASYPQLKDACARIAAEYCGHPSRALNVMAVTGTNGKTSTAVWLATALSNLEQSVDVPSACIGTLGIGLPVRSAMDGRVHMQFDNASLTTPDPVLLQQTLRSMVDTALGACAIEASSIGIVEQRLDGMHIHTAIFTNFTQDHLDYHGSMSAYWQAKASLFQWTGLHSAVVNLDDDKGAQLLSQLRGSPVDVWTYSTRQTARVQAGGLSFESGGMRFVVTEGTQSAVLQTRLIGLFNVSNLLAVIAAMRTLGVPLASAVQACTLLQPVAGRMECLGGDGQPLVAVDYAHTPDALEKALLALKPMATARGGRLWCVFGCGGDRDATKRPLLGAIAGRVADQVVVTSDNPRSEKPQSILCQILLGLAGRPAVTVQPDRAIAIAQAVEQAGAHDVVLVAGKGHEDYQEIAGVRHAFSDRLQVQAALQHRQREPLAGACA